MTKTKKPTEKQLIIALGTQQVWADRVTITPTLCTVYTRNDEVTFAKLQALSKLFGTKDINIGSDIDYTDCWYPDDQPSSRVELYIKNITKWPTP